MRLHRTLRLRLRSLVRRRRVDRDLDEEMRAHLDRLVEQFSAAGLPPDEARAAARREFGNVPVLQEACRDTWRVTWIDDLRRDIAHAFRSMRRTPGYTLSATLSLALAIGANSAIFSLIHVLLLRGLPVASPDELVEVGRQSQYGRGSFSYPLFERLRNENAVFSGVVTMGSGTVEGAIGDGDRRAIGRFVSGNFFDVLGLSPAAGRLFTADADRAPGSEGAAVAVIGHGLWQREFGGRPDVAGRTLTVERASMTIVGVLPRSFHGLVVGRPDEFYLPIGAEPLVRPSSWLGNRDFNWLTVVGRLKPGVSRDDAKANTDVIFGRFIDEFAATITNATEQRAVRAHRLVLESARAGVSAPRREFSGPLLLLMGAVGMVLLIACANVVNLLLARGMARRRELGLRLAIGASRGRLVRQLLTESAALGLIGGSAGFGLAMWITPIIAGLMANGDRHVFFDASPDGRVLAFTAVVSLSAAFLAGVVPAFRSARAAAAPGMRDEGRTLTAGRAATVWTRGMIAGQVALSLLLLTGASLLVASLRNLHTFDAGFDRDNVLMIGLSPGRGGIAPDRRIEYYRQVLDRARRTPGVQEAGLSIITPISGGGIDLTFSPEARPIEPAPMVYVNYVSDGYFSAMGTALRAGRDFGPQDAPGSTPVAIVNEALAGRYFGASSAIGQRVRLGGRGSLEIVGVVASAKYVTLREADVPTIYTNALQMQGVGGLTLTVRTAGAPAALAPAIRREVRAVATTVPVGEGITLADQIDRSLVRERMMTRILGALAGLAVLLASIGLYGVLSYAVARKTNEIGIRLALGATRGSVLRGVLREAALLVALGVVIGVPAAIGFTRLLVSMLYDVTPTEPWVFTGAIVGLFAVALAAALQPAWRALRVDPLDALRYE
jgi:predicted permease